MLVSKGITAPTHLTTKLTMADVETVMTLSGITSSANHHRQPLPPHKPTTSDDRIAKSDC